MTSDPAPADATPTREEQVAQLTARLTPGWVPPDTVAARVRRLRDAPVPAYVLADDADITPAAADLLLTSRRMDAVRALIDAAQRDALALAATWKPGMPDVRPAAAAHLELALTALAEVEAAERGCGEPAGECTDPCHLGILTPPGP